MFNFGIDSGDGWTVSYQLLLVDSNTNSSTVANVTTIQVKLDQIEVVITTQHVSQVK